MQFFYVPIAFVRFCDIIMSGDNNFANAHTKFNSLRPLDENEVILWHEKDEYKAKQEFIM